MNVEYPIKKTSRGMLIREQFGPLTCSNILSALMVDLYMVCVVVRHIV